MDSIGTPRIEKLPPAISVDILSRLPITSLQHCKSVSRLWNSTTKDPLLADAHLSRAPCNSIYILLYTNYPRSKLDLVHVQGPDRCIKELTIPFQPSLPYFDVFTSCNGLICLSNLLDGDPIYIYNPIGTQFRELPRLTTRSDMSVFSVVFGLGFHPVTKAYKVIVMVYYTETNNFYFGVSPEPEAYVLTLGTSDWRHIRRVPYQVTGPASEALVNGRLHWLTRSRQVGGVKYQDIISFDIADEEFHQVPKPCCEGLNPNWSDYHIVELGGCLCAVVRNQDKGNEIWAMKEYNVKESWVKEYVVADYVPRGFSIDSMPPARARRSGTNQRAFRVLCRLENGEIVFAYRCRCLVTYNPESKEFKDLEFEHLPVEFETCVHLGSLVSLETVFGMS